MGNATIFARELGGVLIMVNLIYCQIPLCMGEAAARNLAPFFTAF